jgi:uncharacterized membrane protein
MGRLFKRGLIALLPATLTIAVFYFAVAFLYDYIGAPLGVLIVRAAELAGLERGGGLHDWIRRTQGVLGFALAFVLVFAAGTLMATFLGRPLLRLFEGFVRRIPIVKTVYPYAKQFTEFFMAGEKRIEFKAPVAVPFPDRDTYSLAFVTGDGMRHLDLATERRYVTVFVPTAPTPFTGFVLFVRREDVIPLPISTDEALRLIISAGIVGPEHQRRDPGELGVPPSPVTLPPELEKMVARAKGQSPIETPRPG